MSDFRLPITSSRTISGTMNQVTGNSEGVNSTGPRLTSSRKPVAATLLLRAGRKVIEHLLDSFVEGLDVLVRLVRKRIASGSPPNQCFRASVEQIDNQRSNLIGIHRGSCVSESTETAPPPTAAEPGVAALGTAWCL